MIRDIATVIVILMAMILATLAWSCGWVVVLSVIASLTLVTGLVLVIRDTLLIRHHHRIVQSGVQCAEVEQSSHLEMDLRQDRREHLWVLYAGAGLVFVVYATLGLLKH